MRERERHRERDGERVGERETEERERDRQRRERESETEKRERERGRQRRERERKRESVNTFSVCLQNFVSSCVDCTWWTKERVGRFSSEFLPFSPTTNFIPPFLHTHLIHFVSCDSESSVLGRHRCD